MWAKERGGKVTYDRSHRNKREKKGKRKEKKKKKDRIRFWTRVTF